MSNGWRTINSLVHKIRLHGRRGKEMAESFSRQKSRHAPQKEGGLKILCDLPPVWPRLVRPTNLMSRMDGKKTHTHTHTHGDLICQGSTRSELPWGLLALCRRTLGSERHRYAIAWPDKLGTDPMAYGGFYINKWTPPRNSGGIP